MGIDDGVPVYYSLAEVQVPRTDRLHRTDELKKSAEKRPNKGVIRWNNKVRNLASRNAGRMILTDIEHELRAMDQARLTTVGILFDSIKGQAWMN